MCPYWAPSLKILQVSFPEYFKSYPLSLGSSFWLLMPITIIFLNPEALRNQDNAWRTWIPFSVLEKILARIVWRFHKQLQAFQFLGFFDSKGSFPSPMTKRVITCSSNSISWERLLNYVLAHGRTVWLWRAWHAAQRHTCISVPERNN